jgi:hypothetical protein
VKEVSLRRSKARRSPYRYKPPEPARLGGTIRERRWPPGRVAYVIDYWDAKDRRHLKTFANKRAAVAWRDETLVRLARAKEAPREDPKPLAQPAALRLSEDLHQDLADIKRLLQGRQARERNDHESLPAILRRVTEIERHLRLAETPTGPKPSRRHPIA